MLKPIAPKDRIPISLKDHLESMVGGQTSGISVQVWDQVARRISNRIWQIVELQIRDQINDQIIDQIYIND